VTLHVWVASLEFWVFRRWRDFGILHMNPDASPSNKYAPPSDAQCTLAPFVLVLVVASSVSIGGYFIFMHVVLL